MRGEGSAFAWWDTRDSLAGLVFFFLVLVCSFFEERLMGARTRGDSLAGVFFRNE